MRDVVIAIGVALFAWFVIPVVAVFGYVAYRRRKDRQPW